MIDALGQLLGLAGDEHEVPGLDETGGAGGEEGGVIKRDVPGQGGDGLAGAALGGQALADLVDHGLDLPELGVSLVVAAEKVAVAVAILLPEDLADVLGGLVGLQDGHVLVEQDGSGLDVLEKQLKTVVEPGLAGVAEVVLVVGLHKLR